MSSIVDETPRPTLKERAAKIGEQVQGSQVWGSIFRHVLLFPFVTVIFPAIHFWRVRKDGGISGPL